MTTQEFKNGCQASRKSSLSHPGIAAKLLGCSTSAGLIVAGCGVGVDVVVAHGQAGAEPISAFCCGVVLQADKTNATIAADAVKLVRIKDMGGNGICG
jgi:hypothetical protein